MLTDVLRSLSSHTSAQHHLNNANSLNSYGHSNPDTVLPQSKPMRIRSVLTLLKTSKGSVVLLPTELWNDCKYVATFVPTTR